MNQSKAGKKLNPIIAAHTAPIFERMTNLALRDKPSGKGGRSMASKKKNPAAVRLGRLGGKARAENLTKEQLAEIGRKGAEAAKASGKKLGRPPKKH